MDNGYTQATAIMENKNEDLLEVLQIGKNLNEEVQRNRFTSDSGIAERLCGHCEQFIDALFIASSNLNSNNIMDDVLLVAMGFQKVISHLDERFHGFDEEELHYICPYEGSSEERGRGRPKLFIPKEQLVGLRSLGFSWTSIAELLGVSIKTIRRKREEYDMSSTPECFSNISDDEIDHLVKFVLQMSPNSGERMVMGWFKARGIFVQRWRVRNSIWRVDPVSRELRRKTVTQRRIYNVPTPNALWLVCSLNTSICI